MTSKANNWSLVADLCKRAAQLMGPQDERLIRKGDVFVIDGRVLRASGPYEMTDEAVEDFVDRSNRMVLEGIIGPELTYQATEVRGPFYWVRSPERILVAGFPRVAVGRERSEVKAHG